MIKEEFKWDLKKDFSGEEQQLQTNMKVDGMKADEVQL